jgi:hypothetical protein
MTVFSEPGGATSKPRSCLEELMKACIGCALIDIDRADLATVWSPPTWMPRTDTSSWPRSRPTQTSS